MQQFDASKVPEITKEFFLAQMQSAPPGMKPHTLYLGKRQLKELSAIEVDPSVPDMTQAIGPFLYRQNVTIVPVVADSHYMLTFLEVPAKIQHLKTLLDYCEHLPTGPSFPAEFIEVKALALQTKEAFREDLK